METAAPGATASARPPLFTTPSPLSGLALVVTTRTPVGAEPKRPFGLKTFEHDHTSSPGATDLARTGLLREGYRPRSIFRLTDLPDRPYRYPRNVRWADLPVISDASYDYATAKVFGVSDPCERETPGAAVKMPTSRDHERAQRKRRNHLAENLHRVARVHVVWMSTSELDLWHAIAPVVTRNPGAWISVTDRNGIREMEPADVAALRAKCETHDRLIFNHVFNMSVLAGRAMLEAARRSGTGNWHIGNTPALYHRSGDEEFASWDRFGAFTPLMVQLLISLDTALGAEADIRDSEGMAFGRLDDAAEAQGHLFETVGDETSFVWRGTGKYPEVRTLVRKTETQPEGRVGSVLAPLVGIGAILQIDGVLRISRFGREAVRLLGAPACDPDVVLRWRTEDGMIASPSDRSSVDRWLVRYLRGVKRRVSGLKANALTEPGLPWVTPGPNVLVLRGIRFEMSGLGPAERRAVIRAVIVENEGKPLAETRVGVVYDEAALGDIPEPVAVWCGRPIAVLTPDDEGIERLNSSLDTSEVDPVIEDDARAWRTAIGAEHGALHFMRLPSERPPGAFVDLVSAFGTAETFDFCAVYQGYLVESPGHVAALMADEGPCSCRVLSRTQWSRHPADIDNPAVRVLLTPSKVGALLIGDRIGVAALDQVRGSTIRKTIRILGGEAGLIGPGDGEELPRVGIKLDRGRGRENPLLRPDADLGVRETLAGIASKTYVVDGNSIYEVIGDPASGSVGIRRR